LQKIVIFLGEKQWAWLSDSLQETRTDAAVNVVVSGIVVLQPSGGIVEASDRFPTAKRRLLKILLASGARGLVLISGDLHLGALVGMRCKDTALYEIVSSGLTHSLSEGFKGVDGRLLRLANTLVFGHGWAETIFRNFGELDIEVSDDSAPRITSRLISLHSDGSIGKTIAEKVLDSLSDGRSVLEDTCAPLPGTITSAGIQFRAITAMMSIFFALGCMLYVSCRICMTVKVRYSMCGKFHFE